MLTAANRSRTVISYRLGGVLIVGLYLSKTYSYLLFHSLVELASIMVAGGVFLLAWNSRRFTDNHYYLFLGTGYLFTGCLDLLHTFTYIGMNVIPDATLNTPVQLWISARYLEGIVLLTVPAIAAGKLKIPPEYFFSLFFSIFMLVLLSIFWLNLFPICFIEGKGLTGFKIISEILICSLFLAALFYIRREKQYFDEEMLKWLSISILFAIAGELFFTMYQDMYGITNFLGHYCKLFSYYLIYKAIIETTLLQPQKNLFRGLNHEIERSKRTESELRKSEQRLTESQKVARIGSWEFDREIGKITCSEQVFQLFGRDSTQAEPCYEDIMSHYHPESAKNLKNGIRRAIDFGEESHQDLKVDLPNGETAYHFIIVKPIKNSSGRVVKLFGTIQDITERRWIEDALRQSEERFELAMKGASDGLWDWNLETDEVYYSPRWKAMLGYAETEITNHFNEWRCLVHPKDGEHVIQIVKAYLNKRLPLFRVVFRMRHKEGHYVWILGRAIGVWDEKGTPIRMVGTHVDLTEQKQVEFALHQSKMALEQANAQLNQFKTTLDMTLDSVFMLDPETLKFSYANLGFINLLGYTQAELLNISLFDLETETFSEEGFSFAHGSILPVQRYETEYRHKNGSLIPVEVFLQYIHVNKYRNRFFGIVRDITERKRVESELRQAKEAAEQARQIAEVANQAKSAFLANMSHELRTPLNGILGYTQIFKRDSSLTAQQQEGIDVIHRSGEHLLTLINDVLDLSKVEAQRLELHPTEFELNKFLQRIAELFELRAQQKGIQFHYEVLSKLPTFVEADETRLRQVLLNLLGNAIKFTQQGHVNLKVNYTYPILHFRVEDTGMGIAAESLEKIFLPFEQAGDSNYKAQGTGLGLTISKRLVEIMGGQLHVNSELNQGSNFWFELNLPELVKSSNNTVESTGVSLQNIVGFVGPPREILIVDDKPENCAVLTQLFKPLGFKITEAYDGVQAIASVQNRQPDLILMDLVMPVLDGFKATQAIRNKAGADKIIIIAISASAFHFHKYQSKEAGCDDFIAKPWKMAELLNCVQKHLRLQWIYHTPPPRQETRDSSLEKQTLNHEQAAILLDLTMRGNIDGIIAFTEQLEQVDPKLTDLARVIRQMTEPFQKKRIRDLAKSFLNKT